MNNMIEEHHDICQKNARLVIHNSSLWTKYQEGAQRVFEARRKKFGPGTERAAIEAVSEFDERYGPAFAERRQFIAGKIVREDIFILHRGQVVAQYIDFIVSLRTIDGATNLYCLGLYPELYSREQANAG